MSDHADDVLGMLVGGLFQLLLQVAQRSFGQDVDHPAAGVRDPIYGHAAINEAQGFHAVQAARAGRPGADAPEGLALAPGHAGGRHLHAIDLQLLEQELGDGQLLVRIERDTGGLLAVAQGRVEDRNPIAVLFQKILFYPFAQEDNQYHLKHGLNNTSYTR